MTASSISHALNVQPPQRRLKLTMPSLERQQHAVEDVLEARQSGGDCEEPATPTGPPYSPLTPTVSHAGLAPARQSRLRQPVWMDEPAPVPVNLDDNADAIAIRAAISILQIQRQNALRDIKTLDKMRAAALREPEQFLEKLKSGELKQTPPQGIMSFDDSEDEDKTDAGKPAEQTKFGKFVPAQNIVRCPPVNWAKYHVVGESLDKLHEEQRRRPGTEHLDDGEVLQQPEHTIAAPYRPFTDRLES